MDDAARRAEEIVRKAQVEMQWGLYTNQIPPLERHIATALRELETERFKLQQLINEKLPNYVQRIERLTTRLAQAEQMCDMLAKDSQRHLEAYIERGTRLARVERALRAVMERVYHCPLCKSSVLLSHADKCPIGAALTPDATTEADIENQTSKLRRMDSEGWGP